MNMATARICALAGLLSVCGVGLLLAPSWGDAGPQASAPPSTKSLGPPADLATRVDLAIGLGDPCGGFRGQQCPAQLFCDIPDGCGFADQSHFTKEFRKFMAETPRAYRTRYRKL